MPKLIVPMLSTRNKQMHIDTYMLLKDGNFHCLLNKYWHQLISGEYHMAVPNVQNLSLQSLSLISKLDQLGMHFLHCNYAGSPIDLRKLGAANIVGFNNLEQYEAFVLGIPIGERYSLDTFSIEAYYMNVSMQAGIEQKGITPEQTNRELDTASHAEICFVHDKEQIDWVHEQDNWLGESIVFAVSDKSYYFEKEYYDLLDELCKNMEPLGQLVEQKLINGELILVPSKLTKEFIELFDVSKGRQLLFTDPTRWLNTKAGIEWKLSLGLSRAIHPPFNKRQYLTAIKVAKHIYYSPAKTVWHVQKGELSRLS